MMRADPKTVSKVNKQLAKYCEDNDFIVEWYMWCLNEGDREIDHSTWESCALGQFLYTIGVPEVDLTDIMIGLVMDILACCSLTYRLYLILSSTNCEFPTYKYLADIMAKHYLSDQQLMEANKAISNPNWSGPCQLPII